MLRKIFKLIKIKLYLFNNYFIVSKMVKKTRREKGIININSENVDYLISSHVILKLKIGCNTYYFRECEKKMLLKRYIYKFIDYYYMIMIKEKEYAYLDSMRVKKSLRNKNNYLKFINMSRSITCIDLYPNKRIDKEGVSIVGLENYDDKDFEKRLKNFIRFALCKLNSYYFNRYKYSKYQIGNATKIIAYKTVADYFKMENFVPNVEYCLLKIDKKIIFGTLMSEADGTSIINVKKEERIKKVSPELQKNLIKLNMLDYVCCMRDHTKYNYNVIQKNDEYVAIKVFDNDEEGSFSEEAITIFNGNHGESAFINCSGYINRPYIDKEMVEIIERVKKEDIYILLNKILNSKEMYYVCERINMLKKAIIKNEKDKKTIIFEDKDWSKDSIELELSGKYGKTYLVDFVS